MNPIRYSYQLVKTELAKEQKRPLDQFGWQVFGTLQRCAVKRGIEIGVTRPVSSSVFFIVDDADPKYAAWFKSDGKIDWYKASGGLDALAATEAVKIDASDWDDIMCDPSEIECCDCKEIPVNEAEDYDALELSSVE